MKKLWIAMLNDELSNKQVIQIIASLALISFVVLTAADYLKTI